MSTAARAAAAVVAALVVFGGGWALGEVVDPLRDDDPAAAHGHADGGRTVLAPGHDTGGEGGHDHGGESGHEHDEEADAVPPGLAVARDGYRLVLAEPQPPPGRRDLALRIVDESGDAVVDYDVVHEKRLHLILVRRDLTGFQHVHPALRDGVWRVPVRLAPGAWRVFADFTPSGGEPLTLGADLLVPGRVPPAPRTDVVRTARVDGFEVTLSGDLAAGAHTMLDLAVTRDGEPVRPQPYLGARGHLVALRAGDLAYLHVHPDGDTTTFGVEAPTAGRYHLFFDFRVDGVVRTAGFVLDAGTTDAPEEDARGHGH